MPNEFTTVAMTYNLWGRNFWDKRSAAVRALFTVREPDILGVQELCEESRDLLDEVMNRHTRVEDDFPGWTSGSNIWWRADLYHLEAHGTEDIGTHPLFWVKLNPLSLDDAQPLTFATAHYTWPGNPED